jgi:hypothetical protein
MSTITNAPHPKHINGQPSILPQIWALDLSLTLELSLTLPAIVAGVHD